MKKLTILIALCIMPGGLAYAQQDPNDPGIQDSLIIETMQVDSGATYVGLRLWVETDDSVACYAMPVRVNAPLGGVHLQLPNFYFGQLTQWELHFDTLISSQNYVKMLGLYAIFDTTEPHPPLYTNGIRARIITFRCIINPGTHPQVVIIDTCYDERTRSISFGLTDGLHEFPPAVVPGILTIGGLTGVDEDGNKLPTEFALAQNYPNPFNPETNIDFALPKETDVTLIVYNLLGQEVKSLVNGRVAAGEHAVRWDGKDQSGGNVPSGVYFYKLTTPEFSQTYKMTMLR